MFDYYENNFNYFFNRIKLPLKKKQQNRNKIITQNNETFAIKLPYT